MTPTTPPKPVDATTPMWSCRGRKTRGGLPCVSFVAERRCTRERWTGSRDWRRDDMTFAVRLYPLGSSARDLERQWITLDGARTAGPSRIAIMRTVPEDPLSLSDVWPLCAALSLPSDYLATAWSNAQLVADATLLGLAVGVRVVLVPERRRWFADSLVIRTGGRLRTGRGHPDPMSALEAIRRSYAASFAVTEEEVAALLDLSR